MLHQANCRRRTTNANVTVTVTVTLLCMLVVVSGECSQYPQFKMASGTIDDLATLSELDENSLMEELHARYNKDIIYVIGLFHTCFLSQT